MKVTVTSLLLSFLLLSSNLIAGDWKLATYNIRNFKSGKALLQTDLKKLKNIIADTNADFIGVQEIVDFEGFKSFVKSELPSYGVVVEQCGGSGRQNLGFLYKRSEFTLKKITVDLEMTLTGSCTKGLRPALIGDFYWKQGKKAVRFIGLHLKAGADEDDKQRRYMQFALLAKKIKGYYDEGIKNVVVMGDLNTTDFILKSTYYKKFKSFLKTANLEDFAKDTECTSYWKKFHNDPARYSSKLDHILVSKELAQDHPYVQSESQAHCFQNSCEPAELGELGASFTKVSDHCPVVSSLQP